MQSGPIILIDDDEDDKDVFTDILKDLQMQNPLIWFKDSKTGFDYLVNMTIQPFIIICDINLPVLHGIEFKKQIDEHSELRKKSIPFIFFSTTADLRTVNEAYTKMTIQGFFQKPTSYENYKNLIKQIFEYWQVCRHPNSDIFF